MQSGLEKTPAETFLTEASFCVVDVKICVKTVEAPDRGGTAKPLITMKTDTSAAS